MNLECSVQNVSLIEWGCEVPQKSSQTCGVHLPSDSKIQNLVQSLRDTGALEIDDIHGRGLKIQATSFVGRVQLGDLHITIRPKIHGLPLLDLLRYAFELRHLRLFESADYTSQEYGLLDILLLQLEAEAGELFARGLHKTYERRQEILGMPRGRIDFQRFVREGAVKAALPCIHYPRTVDCLPNQILVQGLLLGSALATDLALRRRLMQLAMLIGDGVGRIDLNRDVMARAEQKQSRLTRAYDPSFQIIKLLLDEPGIDFTSSGQVGARAFLFDMNRFFQALLKRFLHDYLIVAQVQDEFPLSQMMVYEQGFNPCNRRAPTPRPDFAIIQKRKVTAFLDAKYRDLWETRLPREMLYQLAIYALSGKAGKEATILYPALMEHREQRIEIREQLSGGVQGRVGLRAVDLTYLVELISGCQTEVLAQQYARYLAFGGETVR